MSQTVTSEEEKTIVVDINLTKGLVAVLGTVLIITLLLTVLTLTRQNVSAAGEVSAAQAGGMRQFYLTTATYNGQNADGPSVCADGYHFASLWEIADPSNLKYNTTLGHLMDDSGQGPPAQTLGWVRTGYVANTVGIAGHGNCDNWDADIGSGSVAMLDPDWTGTSEDVGIWSVTDETCHPESSVSVWCVED
jgi:hypothetical protein